MDKSEKREKAFNAFLNSAGSISKREIARRFDVSASSVYKWARDDNWNAVLDALTYRSGNDNLGIGNVCSLLPKQTAHILSIIEKSSCEEILWQNILLQYAAIIRAQQMMDIENQNIVQVEKRKADDGNINAQEWENYTPWERYKIFLDTQSKAMNSLTAMLKKYEEYKRNGLLNEELCAKIDFIKHKTESLSNKNDSTINVICNIPNADEEPEP